MILPCPECKCPVDVSAIEIGANAACPGCQHVITVAPPVGELPQGQPSPALQRLMQEAYLPRTGGVLPILLAFAALFGVAIEGIGNFPTHCFSFGFSAATIVTLGLVVIDRLERILRELAAIRRNQETLPRQ